MTEPAPVPVRPRPVGRVVNAATIGGAAIAGLVMVATWILDPATVLPVDEKTAGQIRSVAMMVAFVGGALATGRRTQVNVEAEVTPLSSPHTTDPETGDLIPLVPVVTLEPTIKTRRRPPPAMGVVEEIPRPQQRYPFDDR